MPNFQTIVLDTATPQLRAPGTGDGYSFDSGATNLGTWTTTGLTLSTGSLTLTPGTANGVLYLNGSKVATSGSLLAFDGNSTNPRVAINGSTSDGIEFKIGGTLTSYFYADNNFLALSASGARSVIVETNSSERLRVDGSGNVGIGTSSPAVRLHVQGSAGQIMRVTDGTTGASIYSGGGLFGFNNQTGEDGMFGSTASHFLYFATNGSERMRLNSSGNLGLGVTPSANAAWINFQTQRAVISGGANDRNESSFNSYRTSGQYTYIGNGVATMYQQISGQHIWYQAASGTAGNAITFTQAMTLDASGNLGIGTTSPGALLDVYSATTSNYVRVGSASTFSAGLSIAANANTHLTSGSLVYQDSSNRLNLLNYANAALRLGTNNTFRVSVPAAGGMVVGTAALATNATDGFLYVPTCAGAPTGTPTAQTGTAPIVIDTTNNKLYFYSSGVWRDAGP